MKIIRYDDEILAIVDSFHKFDKGLEFYGNRLDFIQVGRFRYDKGHKLRDHIHIQRPRIADKTQEIVIVFKGAVEVRTYTPIERRMISAIVLEPGDFYISYKGGVGFTVLEDDTRMIEVKNGPYNVNHDDEDRDLL